MRPCCANLRSHVLAWLGGRPAVFAVLPLPLPPHLVPATEVEHSLVSINTTIEAVGDLQDALDILGGITGNPPFSEESFVKFVARIHPYPLTLGLLLQLVAQGLLGHHEGVPVVV